MKFRNMLMLAGIAAFGATSVARADDVSDMKAQMEALQKQLAAVKTQLYNLQEAKN